MSEIKIEGGVPIPPIIRSGRPLMMGKYPWREMAIHDSFFVPGGRNNSLRGAISYAAKATGSKFTLRTVTENGVKGVRVWRVE